MFVLRRSSKEQFTTMRDGKTENGHFPLTLLHSIFFKREQNSRVVLLYLPWQCGLELESILAARGGNILLACCFNLQFNITHASLKSELMNDIMMRAA